ncbi:MAG: nuclear transport factor 2 family protein [Pseudomonadota bacterium]
MLIRPILFVLAFAITACGQSSINHEHGATEASDDAQNIVLGNGTDNRIVLEGMRRTGPSLTVSSVTAAQDSFLVLHPFVDGTPVQTDYVGSVFVPKGISEDVNVRLDSEPTTGEPFIIMLHHDANEDRLFQFGDGVTVPDVPVFEGNTLIALRMQAPEGVAVTPDVIRASAAENAQKYAAYAERATFRDHPQDARARSLIYGWLANVEADDRNVKTALSYLAEDFSLDFPSGSISNANQLEAWLTGPAASFDATRHVLHNVQIEHGDNGTMVIDMEMEWDGLLADGNRMSARTQHEWVVQEIDTELRIMTMQARILESFRLTEWE